MRSAGERGVRRATNVGFTDVEASECVIAVWARQLPWPEEVSAIWQKRLAQVYARVVLWIRRRDVG